MKQFIEISLIMFLLIGASCNKETGPTFVSGTVQDKTTFTGVDNANVGLFEYDDESAFGLSGTLLDEVYSDASGNFTFNFTARKGYSYYVQAIKEQYWNDQSNNVTFIENTGGETSAVVYLQPEGYLSIHILDLSPILNNYEFRAWPFSNFIQLDAGGLDTIISGTIFGNSNFTINWVLEDLISNTVYPDSEIIYCPAFDTTFYELFY
jgi:hypothetical protein